MKKTLLILAVFTLGSTAFSQIPNYVPSNGLVGWWPFNGNANDESGNGNNGTVNGATLTADRFGNANQAYGFDGLSSYIEVPNANNLQLTNNYSIYGWFNANIFFLTSTIDRRLISKVQSTGWYGGYEIFIGGNTNDIAHTGNVGGYNFVLGSQGFTINTWYMFTVTYEGTTQKLYMNGVLINSQPNTGSLQTSNMPLLFGKIDGNNGYFDGSLDDIGIWNRALTECEIQDLYHAQLNSASQSISAGADQSICVGDNVTLNGTGGSNYLWNNNVVDGQAFTPTQSNAYEVTAQDSLGCTGTDTVVVTVLENSASTLTETALDSYTLNGQTYTQSGTYTQTLTAANGCDSTITLNLTLNFTGIDELGTGAKKLVKITDLNGKTIPRRKNTLMLFIYEDGTVERVVEMEE